jgi:hypothetical protein
MNCAVCAGKGWLKACPMSRNSKTHTPKVVALWVAAVMVPCWACFPSNTSVIA